MDTKYIQQFKKGSLEMILLTLISKKETYGYEIITELNKRGGDIFGYAKEGTIYPILYRLEAAEFVSCRLVPTNANGGTRKYYSLTKKGQDLLGELTDFWYEYVSCVEEFIEENKKGESDNER